MQVEYGGTRLFVSPNPTDLARVAVVSQKVVYFDLRY